MKVLVTGAAGFIGARLARALVARGAVSDAQGLPQAIDELVLADRQAPPEPARSGAETLAGEAAPLAGGGPALQRAGVPRIRCVSADVTDARALAELLEGVDSVFPLAATLTVEAESDFARGLDVNLRGLLSLLEACRTGGRRPRLVFASSIAAFGGPLPEPVDDRVQRTPQTSYGTHKAIAELLIDDYSRHGLLDGRSLRLPVVLVRPASPTPSVSDAIAAIIRERLLGRDLICPLDPASRIAAASVDRVVDALIAVHELPAAAFGHTRAMNLPALSVTLAELSAAAERAAQRLGSRIGTIRWDPDPRFQSALDQWPKRFVSEAATRAGIGADASADEIVEHFTRSALGRPASEHIQKET